MKLQNEKVALYIRVSTDKQVNEGYGLEDQKKRLEYHCLARNYDIYKIYCDGESAKDTIHRPQYNDMLSDMKKNKFSKILAIKLDRISRSPKDFYILLEVLMEYNCELEFIDTPIDLRGMGGKAMAGMLSVFSAFERDMIVDRTLRGVNEAVHNGHFGGPVPLGYKKAENSKCLVIDKEKSKIIKEIFDLCLSGKTYKYISNLMNEKYSKLITSYRINRENGEKVPVFRNWKDSSISVILNNKKYMGIYEHKKKSKVEDTIEIRDVIPAIVSEEVFYECQENIKRNARNYYRSKNYLFMQKLRCPKCGRIMACNGAKKSGGSEYLYYKCMNKGCGDYIREELVEKELIDNLIKYLELYMILEENYYPIDSDLVEDFNNCSLDNKIRFAIDSRIINDAKNIPNLSALHELWSITPYEVKCKFIYEFIDYIEVKKYKVKKEQRVRITKLKIKPHKLKKLFELKNKNMLDETFSGENFDFSIANFKNEKQAYEYIDLLKKKYNIVAKDYVKGEEYYNDDRTFKVINITNNRAAERNKSIFISLE